MNMWAQFDEYRIRCVVREDEVMTLSRFQKGLNILEERLCLEVCPPLIMFIP